MTDFLVTQGQLREVRLEGVNPPHWNLSRWVGYEGPSLEQATPQTYEQIWRLQPYVRTLTGFLSRNMAQLGLRLFLRMPDGRVRLRAEDNPLAYTMAHPNLHTTAYRLIEALVGDLAIYDRAFLLKVYRGDRLELHRIPPLYVSAQSQTVLGRPTRYLVSNGQGTREVGPESMIDIHGYHPLGQEGSSPIEALRQILSEDWESYRYRRQMWDNGSRMSGWIERPLEAPEWDDEAEARFKSEWRARYTHSGGGSEAVGTPVLDDGMKFHGDSFSPEQTQFLQTHTLTMGTVAAAYHTPAQLVGVTGQANYSNVKEFHKILYQDTLGPWCALLEQEFALHLFSELAGDTEDLYWEFNIQEKLQGSFDEQIRSMQSSVGAPFMTRTEARERMNLPHLPDADELVIPLNVITGGLASPTDTANPTLLPGGPGQASYQPQTKQIEAPPSAIETERARLEEDLARYLRGQRDSLVAALAGGQTLGEWWDAAEQDALLEGVFLPHQQEIARLAALDWLGVEAPGTAFETEPMTAYLRASARSAAQGTNRATYDRLAEASVDEDWLPGVMESYQHQIKAAGQSAQTQVIDSIGLGRHDAAGAAGMGWQVWRTYPGRDNRPSHRQMNGERVALGSVFSNGARWPGDHRLDAAERIGCHCQVEFQREEV